MHVEKAQPLWGDRVCGLAGWHHADVDGFLQGSRPPDTTADLKAFLFNHTHDLRHTHGVVRHKKHVRLGINASSPRCVTVCLLQEQ
jgi:hypothetical protein